MEKKYFKTSFANDKFEKVNEEFLKCTVSICTHEQIANGTKFTKESLDNALPTLNYLPIVGYFKDGDFQDHGIELTLDSEGFHENVKTVPFGVVIKDSYRYENIAKENGEFEEYLVCDVYLWSRYQEAINVVKDNECGQSMEINVVDGSFKDSYYEIKDFTFSALCILGTATPAFDLGKVRTSDKFSKEDFKVSYSEMIGALDGFLGLDKGGDKMEDEKVLEDNVEKNFSLSANDIETKIRESLSKLINSRTDHWGDTYEYQKYYLEDILVSENVAICESSETWFSYYGIPYSIEQDEIILDVENIKRYIRGDWREFQEGEKELISNVFEVEIKHNQEKLEILKSEFNETKANLDKAKCEFVDLNEKYTSIEEENHKLTEFKANVEKEKKDIELNSVFEDFSELENVVGYSELFERRYDLSIDELTKEMKILAYDNQVITSKKTKQNFSKETIKVPLNINRTEDLTEAERRYGKDIKKYLNK